MWGEVLGCNESVYVARTAGIIRDVGICTIFPGTVLVFRFSFFVSGSGGSVPDYGWGVL